MKDTKKLYHLGDIDSNDKIGKKIILKQSLHIDIDLKKRDINKINKSIKIIKSHINNMETAIFSIKEQIPTEGLLT